MEHILPLVAEALGPGSIHLRAKGLSNQKPTLGPLGLRTHSWILVANWTSGPFAHPAKHSGLAGSRLPSLQLTWLSRWPLVDNQTKHFDVSSTKKNLSDHGYFIVILVGSLHRRATVVVSGVEPLGQTWVPLVPPMCFHESPCLTKNFKFLWTQVFRFQIQYWWNTLEYLISTWKIFEFSWFLSEICGLAPLKLGTNQVLFHIPKAVKFGSPPHCSFGCEARARSQPCQW